VTTSSSMSRILIVIRESRSPRRSVRRGTLLTLLHPMPAALRGSTGSILDSVHRRKIFFAHRVIRGPGRAVGCPSSGHPLRPLPSPASKKTLFAKTTCIARNVTRIHDVEPHLTAVSEGGVAGNHAEVICERSAFTNLLDKRSPFSSANQAIVRGLTARGNDRVTLHEPRVRWRGEPTWAASLHSISSWSPGWAWW
jgi:hypothetical protein